MKKVLLIAAFAVFGLGVSKAQEIKLGVVAALPMGEMDDWLFFGIGLDAAVLWEVGDGFYAGAATGYHHFMGEELELFGAKVPAVDFQYIPIAASARYYVTESIFLGADLGYGIGIGDTGGGDFYYRPKAGYNFGMIGANLSYGGVGKLSFLALGIEIGL